MMYVVKRNGKREPVQFDKITKRITKMCYGLDERFVDPISIAKSVISGVKDGITTIELDTLAAEQAASSATRHPDYSTLAARIAISSLHKTTKSSFSETVRDLYHYKNPKTGEAAALVSDEFYKIVKANAKELDKMIIHDNDFVYDYFGFKTLEHAYLMRLNGKVVERPQYMLMRVAVQIHGEDLERVKESYELMSEGYFTHATPTLFNAGTPKPQMSSCFLMAMKDDSIEGIFDTLKDCAKISQTAGGIGLSIHNVRATGSYIRGTAGQSNGIIPMLRVYNNAARYVDQGGGKRKGSFAIYLEPWHADIFEFLELRKNHGKEELRARDLFLGLWVPDLFMRRVKENGNWSLFCPNEAKGLHECYGAEFEALYVQYEKSGLARKVIPAQELFQAIVEAQIETGTPYMLYKDACNEKSNHKHLGTIKCSNLCTEIVEYTSAEETAVCNLASIALPKFLNRSETTSNLVFDMFRLERVVKVIVRNLDNIIDQNYYPIPEAENSNKRHRPIGIGVQGLADVFMLLGLPFDSQEARRLNKGIFQCLYISAIDSSGELAKERGVYPSYEGSPTSKGILQPHMWGDRSDIYGSRITDTKEILKYGLRNSLLVAPMPTASTSQILGNNECFEPYTSNMYTRRTLSGEHIIVNKHLIKDLIALDMWDDDMRNMIIASNGSIQNIDGIPEKLKEIYKTAWEMSGKVIIDMAADRGPYICQSQSMNIFMESATINKVMSMHMYGWEKGLKTGMYYLRTRPATDPIKFTVDQSKLKKNKPTEEEIQACSLENPDNCLMCGS